MYRVNDNGHELEKFALDNSHLWRDMTQPTILSYTMVTRNKGKDIRWAFCCLLEPMYFMLNWILQMLSTITWPKVIVNWVSSRLHCICYIYDVTRNICRASWHNIFSAFLVLSTQLYYYSAEKQSPFSPWSGHGKCVRKLNNINATRFQSYGNRKLWHDCLS